MGKLVDHLRSPQYTDERGRATAGPRLAPIVAPGRPRWLAYGFYLAVIVAGALLVIGVVDVGGDFIAIIGIVAMAGAALARSRSGAVDRCSRCLGAGSDLVITFGEDAGPA